MLNKLLSNTILLQLIRTELAFADYFLTTPGSIFRRALLAKITRRVLIVLLGFFKLFDSININIV